MINTYAGQPVNVGSYKNITAITAGTSVSIGEGVLYSITLNTPVATSVITLYDGTSIINGIVIGSITIPASPQPSTLFYDIQYTTGLFVVVTTAASDITINYK